jgi:hypothetical protein
MKKLLVYSLLLVSVSFVAQAKVLGYYNSKAETQESDNMAKVETEDDGINFDEWESDFNKSVTKTPKECKGQNCQFKNKQALDPSFDF